MTLSHEQRTERSIDSLRNIYGFVIALAVAQAIQSVLIDRASWDLLRGDEVLKRAPAFFALLFVLVPFFHGMNRHLDFCYIERAEEQHAEAALLFDFIVFFVDSCLLVAVAFTIGHDLRPFAFLGILLAVDLVWATVSHWIHYSEYTPSVVRWSLVNAIVIVVGLFVALTQVYGPATKSWLLLVIALSRFVADYAVSWRFYFPKAEVRSVRALASVSHSGSA